jgi:DNA-binding transcriptional MerR regulator
MTDHVITGRDAIAAAAGVSAKTVSRWIRRKLLPAERAGPFKNSLLRVRVADLERLRPALAHEAQVD